MVYIVNILTIFVTLVCADTSKEPPIIGSARDALKLLKDQSGTDHKYTYEVPKGTVNNYTFFHEYFEYGREVGDESLNGNLTQNQNGFLIEISDESSVFFNIDDIEQYGATNFDIPYGPLRQIETDCFAEVESNWTNLQLKAFAVLEKLASEEDSEALRILGDLCTFGFFNTKVDLDRAKAYYGKILEIESDTKTEAHAHFMLGVFYSTGLFGKTEKNQPKGLIHYRFAADLNNSQAQMALAHKYMFGVNVAQDYETAIYYFSLVYQKAEEYLEPFRTEITKTTTDNQNITERLLIFEPILDKFSVRWSDVDGGLYDSSSEAVNTVRYFETFDSYDKIKTYGSGNFNHEEFPDGDDETLDAYSMLYFAAQKNYNGDYLHARNFDLSFKYAKTCVHNGFLEPEINELLKGKDQNNNIAYSYESPNYSFNFKLGMDQEVSPLSIFVGRCSQYLGHLYLRGQGTEVDYQKAKYYLEIGRVLSGSDTFINDIALMNQYGLGVPKDLIGVSHMYLEKQRMAPSTKYYKAVSLIEYWNENMKGDEVNIITNDIYLLLTSSATYNKLARRKLIELYEGGRMNKPLDIIVGYYNWYLKIFESMYFDFKIPFFAFLNAKADDTTSNNMWTALVGMAIESELGYEAAQSSLGSILYPRVGPYQSKSARNLPTVYSKIYTPKRFHEAISYFELSALHDNRDSINMLGDMYYEGLNSVPGADDPMWRNNWWTYVLPVAETSEKPDSFLFSAIELTFNRLQNLTRFFKIKFNSFFFPHQATPFERPVAIIPKALDRAVSYYQVAASKGSQIGSYSVGWAYEYGMGVVQDLHLAKRYYDSVMTISDAGYIPVKLAVFRVNMKTILWNVLGYDGNGVE